MHILFKQITVCALALCSAFAGMGQTPIKPSAEFIAKAKANYDVQKKVKHSGEMLAHSQPKFCGEQAYSDNAPWRVVPFTKDDSLTFKIEKQWKDPLGFGWETGAA